MRDDLDERERQLREHDARVFVGDVAGPERYTAFFEDDGETGYLYVSDRVKNEIIEHLQIYTNSAVLRVQEKDVQVVWSAEGTKCGVVIWGGMRGIIDIAAGKQGRVLVESRSTPPILDSEWLKGFECNLNYAG